MKKPKKPVHLSTGHFYRGMAFQQTICGKSILSITPSTIDPAKVTCKSCLKRLANQTTQKMPKLSR